MSDINDQLIFAAFQQVSEAISITDTEGVIIEVNRSFEKLTGYTKEEVIGKTHKILTSGKNPSALIAQLWETISKGEIWRGRLVNKRKDGSEYQESMVITPVRVDGEHISHYVAIKRDATNEIKMEQQIRQSQKLEAIGQLAAGIAHEINTPTQYIGDNTRFLQDAFKDFLSLLETYDSSAEQGLSDEVKADIARIKQQIDIEYLIEEVPIAIEQSLEGIGRVAKIVSAMKEFSHPGEDEKTLTDLNQALESTITVARNEWKYVSEMETDLSPTLPLVPCLPGDINQVFLNLITNAAHAIESALGERPAEKGVIRISTSQQDGYAVIKIADTGTGIPKEIHNRIFDPFFTTKEVGKGTGQGLAIAYNVVVEKHGGKLSFETKPGKGTTFIIQLPL